MTEGEAASIAFPGADRFESSRIDVPRAEMKIQKVFSKDEFLGYFVTDAVIGKHLLIDYAVSLSPAGAVTRVEILEYRENYGGEVSRREWLENFKGRGAESLENGSPIPNISGATFSAKHVTDGVKEIASVIGAQISAAGSAASRNDRRD